MKLWYTNKSPFTSYTTITPHSDSQNDFSAYVTSHVQYTYLRKSLLCVLSMRPCFVLRDRLSSPGLNHLIKCSQEATAANMFITFCKISGKKKEVLHSLALALTLTLNDLANEPLLRTTMLRFLSLLAMRVLASIRTMWAGFRECPRTIKSAWVYPWRHTHDKMYQALPLLSRESLGMRLD